MFSYTVNAIASHVNIIKKVVANRGCVAVVPIGLLREDTVSSLQ